MAHINPKEPLPSLTSILFQSYLTATRPEEGGMELDPHPHPDRMLRFLLLSTCLAQRYINQKDLGYNSVLILLFY